MSAGPIIYAHTIECAWKLYVMLRVVYVRIRPIRSSNDKCLEIAILVIHLEMNPTYDLELVAVYPKNRLINETSPASVIRRKYARR